MKNRDEPKKESNDESIPQSPERYTIFHALFEALREKDKKHKKKYRGFR